MDAQLAGFWELMKSRKSLRERLKFIGTIKYETIYPLRTVSPKDRISFYTYSLGSFPYGISNKAKEAFQIWQAE